jgi:hypothetical protein
MLLRASTRARATTDITSIVKRGESAANASRRQEEEETPRQGSRRRGGRDATADLLLKHPDATLATYV